MSSPDPEISDASSRKPEEGRKLEAKEAEVTLPAAPRDACWNYLNKGKCRFGNRCRYRHVDAAGPSDGQGSASSKQPRKNRTRAPPAPNDGFVLEAKDFTSEEKFVDTHIHLDMVLERMRKDWKTLLEQSYPPNFDSCVAIFSDPAAFSPNFSTWSDHLQADNIFGAFGMHPHNAKYYSDTMEERILSCLKHEKAVALGEIGLDFHYNRSPHDVQQTVFRRQLTLARELGKPVVIHSRSAEKETVSTLKDVLPQDHRIHLHCFNDSEEYACDLLAHFPNLFIGITGAVTFASAGRLRKLIRDKVIPVDRILLETDGPYMTPSKGASKKRGRRQPTCHSGHIPTIAATIAQLLGTTLDAVLRQTRANTAKMYGV